MQKIQFKKFINAPREKVWDTMLGIETYKVWTEVFNTGSYFKGDWNEGSKMVFLGPDPKTGKEGGMLGRIAKNVPHEFVSIEYLGLVNDGVEDTTSDEVKKWTPAFENYTFADSDGGTELTVDIDVNDEYKSMFEEMWPKSLEKLTEISEK